MELKNKNGLADFIRDTAQLRGLNPNRTLVNIDYSNVIAWHIMRNGDEYSKISIPNVTSILKNNEFVQNTRIFMPKAYLNSRLIREVTKWVIKNKPDLFNNKRFSSLVDDDDEGFIKLLSLALKSYFKSLNGSVDAEDIGNSIRQKIDIVISTGNLLFLEELFKDDGCEVITKTSEIRKKYLATDKDHKRVVKEIYNIIAHLRQRHDMIVNNLESARADNRDRNFLLAEMYGLKENIDDLQNIIEDTRSLFFKCDLDPDIVAYSLHPRTLEKYDNQVFFSGDGDFTSLYKTLFDAGKNVILISPNYAMHVNLFRLQNQNVVSIFDPTIEDDFWFRPRL